MVDVIDKGECSRKCGVQGLSIFGYILVFAAKSS